MSTGKANVNLAVVGASARSAAASALRAGYRPFACDLFADEDLRAICACVRVDPLDYPSRVDRYLESHRGVPLLFTGGLENYPEVLETLARQHPILGSSPSAVRAARDPHRLHETLRRAGLPSPDVRDGRSPPGSPADWLAKPLLGSGGSRIRRAEAREGSGRIYFQRYVEGTPASAVYVAGRGGARLLGVTRQLVGEPWLHASPFAYCGSVGPLPTTPCLHERIQRLGAVTARAFGLLGLFGVDLVLDGDDPWVVELNPRYTASVEVLETARGLKAVELHARACSGGELASPPCGAAARFVVGKAVLFAAADLDVPCDLRRAEKRPEGTAIPLADVPRRGQSIPRGRPVVTVFADAPSVEECCARLRSRTREVERLLAGRPLREGSPSAS